MAGLGKNGNTKSSSSFSSSSSSKARNNVKTLPPEEWFKKMKEDLLDDGGLLGSVMEGLMRNTVRMTCEAHAPTFGALPSLLGRNLAYIQLLVVDADRNIQGKLYMTGAQVDPNSPKLIASSRKLFKDAIPFLLKDTENWVFSRSLVFKAYNGVIDEAIKFSDYDPVGAPNGLLEPPSMGSSGIRCAEVFVFVAGNFEVDEDGLCSREAVKKLLQNLNSEEGISKLLAFDCVAASALVPKKKLKELKDTHLNLNA